MAYAEGMATQPEETFKGPVRGGNEKPNPLVGRLSTSLRQRIMVLFAQFHTVKEVGDLIFAETGQRLSVATLCHYDPMKARAKPSKRLLALYDQARDRHLSDLTTIGVAHQAHRLRVLDRMVNKAEHKDQFTVAAQLLKQAAEEMGGLLTNKRSVTHFHITPEDARRQLAEKLHGLIEARPGEEGDSTT